MAYLKVGDIFLAGLSCNEKYSQNNHGEILIGGDKADVYASQAINDERDGVSGVLLSDVELKGSGAEIAEDIYLNYYLTPEELTEEIVRNSYDSIGGECFNQHHTERTRY